jgi:5'-methylthioadenosine phosphorylase
VSIDTGVSYLNKNVRNAQLILREAIKRLKASERDCKCGSALEHAIFTQPDNWPEATAQKLEAIIKKYRR